MLSTWLTIMLIIVGFHGLLLLPYARSLANNTNAPAWFLATIAAVAVADIIAAVALWKWQFWGFYLYLITSAVAIGVGLLATGSMLFVFSRIVPVAILGVLLRPKWNYFGISE